MRGKREFPVVFNNGKEYGGYTCGYQGDNDL
jgi:hypothetical protein